MKINWLPLSSIPKNGMEKTIDDQNFWLSSMVEFSIDCKIIDPIVAKMNILPDQDGVLFKGRITGKVALPCNLCMEDALVELNHRFTSFEPLPEDPYGPKRDSTEVPIDALGVDEAVVRVVQHGRGFEINPSALAWEEFSLALPVKPVCAKSCKGLCPVCGHNQNNGSCQCEKKALDPRLEALQGLVVKKKS